MKQSEKTKITYDKILNCAIKEFGTKSYGSASLNNICSDNNISKGLIYHNFKNKDELYLRCVEECFKDLTVFLSNSKCSTGNFKEGINELMHLRYRFFKDHPYYSNIFFNTVLQPPRHLIDEIKQIRAEFDNVNLLQYRKILKSVKLRENITEDAVLEYFFIFQELFNGYFQSRAYESSDFHSLIKDHEIKLSEILNIMLYGIAKETPDNDNLDS